MNIVRIIFLFLVLCCFQQTPLLAQDQSSCAFILQEAEKQYQLGLIEKIPSMLKDCLAKGFTRQERQDAYKLLLRCYLLDDDQQKADSAMLSFLKKYPEYEILPTDARDFVYLFESFRTLPILSIGLLGGFNAASIGIIESRNTNNLNAIPRDFNRSGMGIKGGLSLNFFLSNHWELGIDFLYSQSKFESIDTFSFFENKFQELSGDETQNRLMVPVSAIYTFHPWKKIIPYARGGIIPGWISQDKITLSRRYIDNSSHTPVVSPDIDIPQIRNSFGIWGVLGAGVRYKIPRGYFFGEFQFQPGFSEQLNKENKYAYPELIYKYHYESDNFRLHQLSFSVGYCYSFYRPSKKK